MWGLQGALSEENDTTRASTMQNTLRTSEAIRLAFTQNALPLAFRNLFVNPFAERIMQDFRTDGYVRANPDLHFPSVQHARWHFVYNGYREQRLMDPERAAMVDPAYYRGQYPELRLASDAQAQMHYCYFGYYEDRFPNADTEWMCNVNLLVYQHGRVGSHAIGAALAASYPGRVWQLHWPTDLSLNAPGCSIPLSRIFVRPRPKPLQVISGARDVVARVVSGTFEYLDTIVRADGPGLQFDEVVAYLDEHFLDDCEVIAHWFDHQFHCGLDIYQHPFNQAAGYIRIGNRVIDLFLYRMEDLPRLAAPLGEFLGVPGFKLSKKYTSKGKDYGCIYHELSKRLVFPKLLLRELYATPYMRFFFSEDERSRLIERWSRPRP